MNILLYPDLYAGPNNNNIIFTKLTDYQYDNLDVAKSLFKTGYCEIYAQKYADVVGEDKQFTTDVDFFKYLANNKAKEYRIYADCESYAAIVCKYLKLFLPNLSADQAYINYKLSLDYFYLYYKYLIYEIKSLCIYDPNKLTKDTFVRLSKDQFIELFINTAVTGDVSVLENDFNQYLSTEYKIANYLSNDIDDLIEGTLLVSLREIIAKNLQAWYHEVQYNCLLGIFNNQKYQMDISDLISTHDFACSTNKLKLHQVDNIIDCISNSIQDDPNVIKNAEQAVFFLEDNHDTSKIETQIKQAIQLLNNNTIDGYLNILIESYKETGAFPNVYNRVDSLNPYLIEYIFDLYINNETDKLKQFKI